MVDDISPIHPIGAGDAPTHTLRTHYPGAADAVEMIERVYLGDLWAKFRAGGHDPRRTVDALIRTCPDCIPAVVRAQLAHPDFLRFVVAKLGAV